jgi:hypothetical protein
MNNNSRGRFKALKKKDRQALARAGMARISHKPKVGSWTFSTEQKKHR